MKPEHRVGDRVLIPACQIEYVEGGNTIWVHSPLGATVLRIKTTKRVRSEVCATSPVSHADIIVGYDIVVCLGNDLKRRPKLAEHKCLTKRRS